MKSFALSWDELIALGVRPEKLKELKKQEIIRGAVWTREDFDVLAHELDYSYNDEAFASLQDKMDNEEAQEQMSRDVIRLIEDIMTDSF